MLYEVVVYQTYFQQQIVNRWNYVSSGVPASVSGSFGLTSALGFISDNGLFPANSLFAAIRAMQVPALAYASVTVRAAADYDVEDFYERPFITGTNGTGGGEGASPAIAYGFRTNRVRLDIDRATKRIAGVTEDWMVSGGLILESARPALDLTAQRMSEVLTYNDEGNTITYSPCVVQKQRVVLPNGNVIYRYYPTLSEQLDHIATGIIWQRYDQVRTQRSRQYGTGS